jgi:hypothetical protein
VRRQPTCYHVPCVVVLGVMGSSPIAHPIETARQRPRLGIEPGPLTFYPVSFSLPVHKNHLDRVMCHPPQRAIVLTRDRRSRIIACYGEEECRNTT